MRLYLVTNRKDGSFVLAAALSREQALHRAIKAFQAHDPKNYPDETHCRYIGVVPSEAFVSAVMKP